MINRTSLLASTAVALSLLAGSALAQQDKGPQSGTPSGMPQGKATGGEDRAEQPGKASPQGQLPDRGKGSAQTPSEKGKGSAQTEPSEKGKGSVQKTPSDKSKGTAQTEPSEKGKGSAQTQPTEKGKGSAQKAPSDKSKGTAQTEPSEKGKGSAQTQPTEKGKGSAQTQPAEKGKGSAQTQPPEKGKGTATAPSSGSRVQLSEQQRTDVHSTVLKERNVNRVNNVNVSINVGTRVPRSVRLAVLPVAVISLVPQYRGYQYFVVDDRICIVEPRTYEIVEVISESGRMAGVDSRGSAARLVLTEDEKRIILQNVEFDRDSTLALGSLREGTEVPRNVRVKTFPETVVEQLPKVRDYKFFTAEDRVAIVDPQGSRVALVIEERR
jgi:hypothetical protein